MEEEGRGWACICTIVKIHVAGIPTTLSNLSVYVIVIRIAEEFL